jgi:hypothetical protein
VTQTLELEECRDLVAKEIGKRKSLESRLALTMQEINRHKMLVHHAEQEVRRMDAIIEVRGL